MGKGFAILFSVLLLLAITTANASITGWGCADDGDGAIVMSPTGWTDNGDHDYTYSMNCAQHGTLGHLLGDFTTDTELDPTVGIIEDISNDTTFDWSDYHITIGMTKAFTFLNSGLMAPDGWTEVVGPVLSGQPLPGNISPGTGWVGTVNYYQSAGDPVAIGDDGLFGFKISFTGSTDFYTAQVPTPEPATIGLLGFGAMALLKRRKA